MGIAVKICGINSREAAHAAIAAGADFAGLVFHAGSPRRVSGDVAAALANSMRGRLRVVAVFSDAGDAEMANALSAASPDLIQLHGNESPARVAHLQQRFGIPVIKAIAVADKDDLSTARSFEDLADYLLFDSKPIASTTRLGGHGVAFDWKILSGTTFKLPWILSGGLTPANVAQAIATSGARMVDVSSGVEDAPGQKSAVKIAGFVKAAKSAAIVGAP